MADFNAAVAKTIINEGGSKFTNDPDDKGGPTRYGIAQNYHPGINAETLTEDQAKEIYRREYWTPIHGDEITSQGVAEMLFDSAVNLGVGATVKVSRAVLGAEDWLPAVNAKSPSEFIAEFILAKIARYVRICEKTPTSKKYFYGWVRRALQGVA